MYILNPMNFNTDFSICLYIKTN